MTACNLSHTDELEVVCQLDATQAAKVNGQILHHTDFGAFNTFEQPNHVQPVAWDGITLENNTLRFVLPPASVGVLAVEG